MKIRNTKAAVFFLAALMSSLCLVTGAMGQAAPLTVAKGRTVQVNYTLTVDGKVIDSSKGRQPLEVKIGAHQVIPGFEKGLMGMKVGEKKSFTVKPEDGYGEVNPKAILEVPKSKLPKNIKLTPGMVLESQVNGHIVPVSVVKVKKETVVLDFNSPLAGKTLNFDVEVVDIK